MCKRETQGPGRLYKTDIFPGLEGVRPLGVQEDVSSGPNPGEGTLGPEGRPAGKKSTILSRHK